MQEIMHLMDKFVSSSEGVLHENQGAPFVYKLTSKGGKDQDTITKIFPKTKTKDRSSYDKTPYLDHGDNDV